MRLLELLIPTRRAKSLFARKGTVIELYTMGSPLGYKKGGIYRIPSGEQFRYFA